VKAVNLIPADQRRGAGGLAGRSGGIMYVVVGGLAVVVGLGVLYAFAVKSVADRKGQLASVTEQVDAVQAQAAALTPYVQVSQLRQQAVANVVSLAQGRFNWPDAMQQLVLALPSDVTLTALSGSAGAPSPGSSANTSSSPTGAASFSMSGCASSEAEVATVLHQLAQVPGVASVSLANATKAGKAPNAGRQVPRKQAEAVAGQCPLVSFNLSLAYAANYTLPNEKLPAAASGTQTVSSASSAGSVRATTRQPAAR